MKNQLSYKHREPYYCDRFLYLKHDLIENTLNGFGITFAEFLQCQSHEIVSILVLRHLVLLDNILNIINGSYILDKSGIDRIITENIICDADLLCLSMSRNLNLTTNFEDILSMHDQIVHLEDARAIMKKINSMFLYYSHDDYENLITFNKSYDVAMFAEKIIDLKFKNKLHDPAIIKDKLVHVPSYFHKDSIKQKIKRGILIDFDSINILDQTILCYEIEISGSYDYADVSDLISKCNPVNIRFNIK